MQSQEQRETAGGREQRLDEVLAAYLQARAAGEPLGPDQLITQHPELAADLTEFFADQDRFRTLATPLRMVARAAQGRSPTAS